MCILIINLLKITLQYFAFYIYNLNKKLPIN